jgi:hypothetical protein
MLFDGILYSRLKFVWYFGEFRIQDWKFVMASLAVRFCPLVVSFDPIPTDLIFSGSLVLDFLVKTPGEALFSSESMSCTSSSLLRLIWDDLVVHVEPLLDTAATPVAIELAHIS